MVIHTACTLALFCPACGKIQMHDISPFIIKKSERRDMLCSCGQVQAVITGVSHNQYLLNVPCVVCETNHMICLDSRKAFRKQPHDPIQKLYCPSQHMELGFIGERAQVEQVITDHNQEFERMTREHSYTDFDGYEDYEEQIENPQVMFEVLNKIHDIAEKGRIYCQCGQNDIEAVVLPDCIELECRSCGSRQVIAAANEKDRMQAEKMEAIELSTPRYTHHN